MGEHHGIFGNLMDGVENLGHQAEYFEDLIQADGVRFERIVSRGQSSPEPGIWYDQDWLEVVLVVEGWAVIEMEGRLYRLEKGAWLFIAPHARHRVLETSVDPACVWFAIHVGEK